MRKPSFSEANATPSLKPASTANKRYLGTLALLFTLSICTPATFAVAQNDPALKAQTQAYIMLVYADEARDLEQWSESKKQYSTALSAYKGIQKNHRDFNTEIIEYRIAYCLNQLSAIEQRQQKNNTPNQRREYDATKYQALAQENAYLRSRLEDVEEELESIEPAEDLQREIQRLKAEVAKIKSGQNNAEVELIRELEKSKRDTEHFRTEVDKQKNELANLKVIEASRERDVKRIQDLSSEIRSLKIANSNLTKTLDEVPVSTEPSEEQKAALQLLEGSVANEKNINRQLIQQLSAADQAIKSLTDEVDEKSKESTSFGQQIATMLKREQEQSMALAGHKKDLTALLREQNDLKQALNAAQNQPGTPSPELEKKFQNMENEVNSLTARWTSAQETIQDLEDERKALTQRNVSLQQNLEAKNKQLSTHPDQSKAIETLEQEVVMVNQALAETRKELDVALTEGRNATSGGDQAQNRIIELESSLKNAQNGMENKQQELEALSQEHRAVQTALQQAASDLATVKKNQKDVSSLTKKAELASKLERQIDDTNASLSSAEARVQELTKALDQSDKSLTEERTTHSKLIEDRDEELKALTSRIAQVQSQSEAVATERDELKKSVKSSEDSLEDLRKKNAANTEVATLTAQVGAITKERNEANENLVTLQQKLQSVETQHATFITDNKKLKESLKSSLKTLDSVQAGMTKSMKSQTQSLQNEVERLVEELAELKSYQESVGGITGKELDHLRRELSEFEGAPAPAPANAPEQSATPLDVLLNQAVTEERAGNLDQADALYQSMLEQNEDYTPALKGLARIYLQTDKSEEAIRVLNRLLKIQKNDPDGLLHLGMAYYNLDDYRKAISTLKKLVKKEEENVQAWNALGASFMAQEDYRDARASFERAITINAAFSDAQYNLSQVLRFGYPEEKELAGQHYAESLKLGNEADPEMDAFLKP